MTLSMSISLMFLWFLFAFAYRSYRVDYVRENLFSLRDELFAMAEGDHGISFSDDAYALLRSRINSTIRYAHRMTAIDVVFMVLSVRNDSRAENEVREFESHWKAACNDLSPQVATQLNEMSNRIRLEVLQQVLFTSLLFWAMVLPAVVYFAVKTVAKQALETTLKSAKASNLFDRFDVASGQSVSSLTS